MLRLITPDATAGNASRIPFFMLSLGQLISWGTLYYGITFIAEPIRHETSWSLGLIYGAFSSGLLLTAVITPIVGRLLHQYGGRTIMSAGSLLAASALVMIASSHNLILFHIGWLLVGAAMAMTLYEAAFATLREMVTLDFRRGVSIITIVGGFASTLYWPLTHWLADELGWRITVLIYAGMHLLICFPMHLALGKKSILFESTIEEGALPVASKRQIVLLAVPFALTALVTAAMSAHASLMMSEKQVPAWLAMTALALIGPMQVAGRIAELSVSHRVSSMSTGMIALATLAASLLLVQLMGYYYWLALAFVFIYGASNGVMTVVRGTILHELFDKKNYALMQGMLSAPALFARALGPVVVAWIIDISDINAAIWTLILSIFLAGAVYMYASRQFVK